MFSDVVCKGIKPIATPSKNLLGGCSSTLSTPPGYASATGTDVSMVHGQPYIYIMYTLVTSIACVCHTVCMHVKHGICLSQYCVIDNAALSSMSQEISCTDV